MHCGIDECQWIERCKVCDVLWIAYLRRCAILMRLWDDKEV